MFLKVVIEEIFDIRPRITVYPDFDSGNFRIKEDGKEGKTLDEIKGDQDETWLLHKLLKRHRRFCP
jgi:hypothetical protein